MDPANEDMSTRQIAEVLYNVPNLEKDDRKVWIQHADSKLYAEVSCPPGLQRGGSAESGFSVHYHRSQ
jgi:hypothetical protein